MTPGLRFLALLFAVCFTSSSCSQTASTGKPSSTEVFTGSTPCDTAIQALLKIPPTPDCDFIRWHLTLNKESGNQAFELQLVFGEGAPNTVGFKGGGTTRTYIGKYQVSKLAKRLKGALVQLTTKEPAVSLSLVQLSDDIYHLLTPDGSLMIGNSGWSYTLNRAGTILPASSKELAITPSLALLQDTAGQVIYAGRTACQEFARLYERTVGSDCRKLKWELTLNRDPLTFLPTTYQLEWTLSRHQPVEGKWTALKGYGMAPNAVVYQLDPDQPGKTIYLLAGDRNVLFFLDKEGRLIKGDENFSYTLNRVH
jgi:hypothetical protein